MANSNTNLLGTLDVHIDSEDILIGLEAAGLPSTPKDVIDAIERIARTLQYSANITMYADFRRLFRSTSYSTIIDQLEALHIKTVNVNSLNGKNSSDMEIFGEVFNQLSNPNALSTQDVMLVTMDGDYRKLIDVVHKHNKQVILVGLASQMSQVLRDVADVVFNLEDYLNIPLGWSRNDLDTIPDQHVIYLLHLLHFLHSQQWKWIY